MKTAHWYARNGEPMHTMAKKDGSGERATTVADARRLGLLPSVTSVLGILDKPQLTSWKINQAVLASLRVPKEPSESEEYWAQRVRALADAPVEDAADRGTEIHDALERAVAGEAWDEAACGVYVRPVLAFIRREGFVVFGREERLVNAAHGFAGTADLLFGRGDRNGILDYKTKKTKPGEKVLAYDEHRLQLAAYAATRYGEACLPRLLAYNVFISTTEPGRVEIVQHEHVGVHWLAFKMLAGLWRYLRNYDPRFEEGE